MIVQVRVPLPFDQILDFAPSSVSPGVQNLFDFVLFFSVDQIGRGLRKVRSMEVRLLIGGECYALTGRSSRREVSWSGVVSGLSALATCDADMW